MSDVIIWVEGLRLLRALLEWERRSGMSTERLVGEYRRAEAAGEDLPPERLAAARQRSQAALDKLAGSLQAPSGPTTP